MRRQRDPAIERIVPDSVSHDQVVVRGARVITQQNPTGIILDQVIRDNRVVHAAQMNSFAAVKTLIRLKGWNARASGSVDIQIDVVLQNVIARDRNSRSVGDENPLEVRILHLEARHRNASQTGVIQTIHVNAVLQPRGIDDRIVPVCPHQRDSFADDDVLVIRALRHLHNIASRGRSDCSPNRRIGTSRTRILRNTESRACSKLRKAAKHYG